MNKEDDIVVARQVNNDLIEAEYVAMDNTEYVAEEYCGPKSCIIAGILIILFWPASLCVLLCPCDSRIKKKNN